MQNVAPESASTQLSNPTSASPATDVDASTGAAQTADTGTVVAEAQSCTASEITPAVYEQVEGEVQVVQAQHDSNGNIVQPPIYRKGLVPKLVTPRGETRFAAPCPESITPEFIASLQRALYARGYMRGAITGVMDAPTRQAVLAYQSARGLKSDKVSLKTAQDLGLVAVALD